MTISDKYLLAKCEKALEALAHLDTGVILDPPQVFTAILKWTDASREKAAESRKLHWGNVYSLDAVKQAKAKSQYTEIAQQHFAAAKYHVQRAKQGQAANNQLLFNHHNQAATEHVKAAKVADALAKGDEKQNTETLHIQRMRATDFSKIAHSADSRYGSTKRRQM